METAKLKKFAQFARRSLLEQVSAKLKLVLAENSAARRESTEAIKKLEEAIKGHGKEQVIERVAYIWFNRFCALRFMDVNRYNRVNIVSPADPGQFQPEILAEAKMGHIDEEMVQDKIRQQIRALLDGKAPSRDPQAEAYRLLVVAACNFWNKAMPFMFEEIDDYTEMLMPDDLLSGNSILAFTREAMTPETCEDVEVIGWLYQFYISEKKDEVFDGLKKNQKITPENIPAATQLFTPHWIVRYLVENSLGRLWLLNRPGSKLVEQMDYYIKPDQVETDFLRISKPEEIKICDPACGSGHMLTYAFDLLYAIYEEEGYEPAEIPENILTNNLFGIEIDERAGELAAFALTMKARAKQRRFFSKGVKPNICVLEKLVFDENELVVSDQWLVASGASREDILHDLNLFVEADNFGSLLRPRLTSDQCTKLRDYLTGHWSLATSHSLFDSMTHQKVLQALRQADYLSPKYHVVIANPPYMGGKGMNGRLKVFLANEFPLAKADLMTCFMEQANRLTKIHGKWGMINLPSWMFTGTYSDFRTDLLGKLTIDSMLHLGRGVFGSDFGSVAFACTKRQPSANTSGVFRRLYENHTNVRTNEEIRRLFMDPEFGHFNCIQSDLLLIPGAPIAYWATSKMRSIFKSTKAVKDVSDPKQGIATGENDRFLRFWHEVVFTGINFSRSAIDAPISPEKWYPYSKGGPARKWYGNMELVVDWSNDGYEIKNFKDDKGALRSRPQNLNYQFREAATWSLTSFSTLPLCARWRRSGCMFDINGMSAFPNTNLSVQELVALLSSRPAGEFIKIINPTLAFQSGDVGNIPVPNSIPIDTKELGAKLIHLSQNDWDSYETSWDFIRQPLLDPGYRQPTLKATYQKLRAHWLEMTLEMQRLEVENNRIFIEAYGLQDELKPEVPLNEITLTCNPHYRYQLSGRWLVASDQQKEEELEKRLLEDTMKELVSYAVGCMFGRYALDKPGLILANQGETLADFVRKVVSDQWPVASNSGENNEREALQGSDCVAEGHGSGAVGLSSNQDLTQGRTVRLDQSGASGGNFDSIQHSGRASEAIGSGVQKLSLDREGIVGGSGNPIADCNAAQLSNSGTTSTNHGSSSGSQQNDPGTDGKTGHWPLDTSHLSFVPDEDNVIPMLDGDWFPDDIAERFRKFLRVAFGEEHYEENLQYVEQALNIKGKRNYSIRDYFLGEFYNDHVRRYKKRPIYWLFSSPKGSFNALIYMHRYRPDTVSVVLNDYLREFRTKLTSHKNHLEAVSISASSSQGEKTKALKEIEKITKMIAEMEEYERVVLYPLATEQVEIDLDDGVKVNYPKFGMALKKISGLDESED